MAKRIVDIRIGADNTAVALKKTDDVIVKVLAMWGGELESAAKKLCPVDTGLLRNSITWAIAGRGVNNPSYKSSDVHAHTEATKKAGTEGKKVNPVKTGSYSGQAPADKIGARSVYVGTNVEYAPYQELGTSKMDAQPFLRPAVERNKDHLKDILEGELKNA